MIISPSGKMFKRTENCLVLPEERIGIKGLRFIGYGDFHQAESPLQEHYHPYCMEVTVMMGGGQRFLTKGMEYSLNAGNAFTNFLEEPHSTGDEPHGVSEFIYFGLDLRESEGFLGLSAPFDRLLYQKAKNWNRRMVGLPEEGIELLHRAFQHFAKLADDPEDWDSRLQGHGYFLTFINRFFEMPEVKAGEGAKIGEILEYVEAHIAEPLPLEELLAFSGLSEFCLRERFKTAVGMMPREYINREKIERAKGMLRQKEKPTLTEIAYRLGFTDSAYFSKLFRQFVSCSPSEYHRRWLRKISSD